jgi:hypothetical protein
MDFVTRPGIRRRWISGVPALALIPAEDRGSKDITALIVNSLHVENVLTFGTFDLRFDGASLVVVGPNGAGKSNVVRVVDLVQKAADSVSGVQPTGLLDQAAGRVLQSFAAARHHGEPVGQSAMVRLAASFTTPSERSQLAVFVRAAVLATLLQEISSGDEAFRLKLTQWVEDELTDDRLSALYEGVLALRHTGMAHVPWEISYEFSQPVAILLLALLHFLPDPDNPAGVVTALADGLAPGSFVTISHLTADFAPEQVSAGVHAYNALSPAPVTPRTHVQVSALFDGLSLVAPGVVTVTEWRADNSPAGQFVDLYAGLARAPGTRR